MSIVPLFESKKRRTEYINQCFDRQTPALLVDMVNTRKWAAAEFDMLATAGWATGEPADSALNSTAAILTPEAVKRVNELAELYGDTEEIRYSQTISALSTCHGATYVSFPDMRPAVAHRFATQLQPIVTDETNWETRPIFSR